MRMMWGGWKCWQRPPEASPVGTARSWGLAAPLKKTSKKQTQALQCWLVQDGCDVHKWLTWIEGLCSMKTKRHLLAYQLHGKQWHFPFGSAWPSSNREEDHSSRSEVTWCSGCLLRVVCVVHWFIFLNVDFISVCVSSSPKADWNTEGLNHSNYWLLSCL